MLNTYKFIKLRLSCELNKIHTDIYNSLSVIVDAFVINEYILI